MRKIKVDFEEIKKIAKKYFKDTYGGHGWSHVERVFNLSRKICEKEKINLNVVGAAALLHDIARKKEDEGKIKDHAVEGAKMSEKILKKLGYDDDFIKKVSYCIKTHRYSRGIKPKTIEAKALQDADRLDALGAIAIARIFAYGGQKKQPIYANEEINKKHEYKSQSSSSLIHFYEKILKMKPETFNTRTAREMAKKRYKFTEDYVEEFLKEWKGGE